MRCSLISLLRHEYNLDYFRGGGFIIAFIYVKNFKIHDFLKNVLDSENTLGERIKGKEETMGKRS